MTEMELQASAAFASELQTSLALHALVGLAGFDVVRQAWMLGWGQGRFSAFEQVLAMQQVGTALRQ